MHRADIMLVEYRTFCVAERREFSEECSRSAYVMIFTVCYWKTRARLLRAEKRSPRNDETLLKRKLADRVDNLFLFAACQSIVERQAHESVADVFGHREITFPSAKLLSHFGEM